MEREYRTIEDKAEWGEGPWLDEPDKIQFTDEATGLPCLVKRNPGSGALCGYVGVTREHPYYGKSFRNDSPEEDEALWALDVHGGITFTDRCQPGPEAETICHIPEPGQSDDVWWLGFDCAHAWDIPPAMNTRLPDKLKMKGEHGESYKTVGYVRSECASLARQLAAL